MEAIKPQYFMSKGSVSSLLRLAKNFRIQLKLMFDFI